jgi:Carboxypeptidase regulatory-like domain
MSHGTILKSACNSDAPAFGSVSCKARLCALFFLLAATAASAQFNSGFTGVIVEQTGSVVAGAKILATNQSTQVSQFSISTGTGDFRILSLPGGVYTIQVSASGFKPWVQKDVVLESNEVKTLHPSLSLPTQETSVEVSGAVSLVETDRSETSREISEHLIDNAPLLGRNIYTSMIELAPGVTGSGLPSGGALGSGSNNNDSFEQEQGYQLNAAGQRQESNEYDVDGSTVNSASRDGVVNLAPEPDFVQAMRVSGATFDAAKGRYSGAWVQVFTQPGSNGIHGTLSEYHTDNDLSGHTIFQNCAAGGCLAFRRNEFGGTVGGPIVKDKLFFFGGAFVLRSSNAATNVAAVETQQFAQFVEQNFPNNIASAFFKSAPPAAYPVGTLTIAQVVAANPGLLPLSGLFLQNSSMPAIGTVSVPESLTHNASQWHVRTDYNIGQKDRLFFDLFRTNVNQLQEDARPLFQVLVPNAGFYAKLDWTHVFTPTLLNDAGFTVTRAVGSNPATASNRDLPSVGINGISDGFNNQWGPAGWVHENFNWHDVLTWTHGRHTISGGIDIDRHHDDDKFTDALIRPSFQFNNLIDFAQDTPYSQSGPALTVADSGLASNLYQILRWIYVGGFVKDDWKVNRRFTLNLGLRYDDFGHWGNYHNSTTPFPLFAPGSGTNFAAQVADGVMQVINGNNAYVIGNRPMYVSPRVGFGWDVFGDGKTAIRGGYGLYYNNVADGSWSFDSRANPPVWAVPSFNVTSTVHPFSYALGSANGSIWPVPSGISFQANSAGGIVGLPVLTSGVNSPLDQPRTSVWMLALQKDLGHNLIFEADYNGSHSNHLYVQTDVNRFPGDLIQHAGVQTRLNPNFGEIDFGRTIGVADGNYGTFMLSKRLSHNWQMRGIYIFGKATDDLSSNDNGTNNAETVIDSLNVGAQHGLADFDISKRFTLDSLWTLPSPFQHGVGNAVLGGWQVSSIVVLQSGTPFTVYTSAPFAPIITNGAVTGLLPGSGDFNADGYNFDVPNRPAPGAVSTGSRGDFMKGFAAASAFPIPALESEGNLGRNSYIGPGLANVNMQFSKAFTYERYSLQFRADVFNLFNRVNLSGSSVISDLSSSQFGQATAQSFPRYVQLGLHFSF